MQNEELDRTYIDILDHLNTGHCVLLLGPELSVSSEGIGYKSYFKELAKSYSRDPANNKTTYYPEENLFLFEDIVHRRLIRSKLKDFYKHVGDPVLLEMIARVRFPLIINVCPDKAINGVFREHNIEIVEGFFSTEHEPEEIDKPSADKPVIYNIFGSVDDDRSLIITPDKLYETLEKLLPEGSLPRYIEKYVNNANSFIFLGFSFDSWYYQLICHRLGIFQGDDRKNSLSTLSFTFNNEIMKNHFKMVFTPENPTQALDRIIKECSRSNCQLLRNKISFDHLSLFISYAWGDNKVEQRDRETVVKWFEGQLEKATPSVQFFKDKDITTYGDSIESFMERIGHGKSVIRVVSDKYLKSRYCMIEALKIYKYHDEERRVFTILWDDIKQEPGYYKKYWKEECNRIFAKIDENLPDIVEREQYKKPHMINLDIYAFIDKFLEIVLDEVHLKVTEQDFVVEEGIVDIIKSRKEEFEEFMSKILQKMKGEQ